jgi:hypothetical protein
MDGVESTVEFVGVEIVRESERALCCHITGRDYWIASDRLLAGSSVAHFGDRGMIVLARCFAEERGLLLGRGRPLS